MLLSSADVNIALSSATAINATATSTQRPIECDWGQSMIDEGISADQTHTHSLIRQCGVLAGESERISDASHAQERDAIFYFFSWFKFLFCLFSDFVLYRSKLVANTRWTRIFRMMRNKTITNRNLSTDPWTIHNEVSAHNFRGQCLGERSADLSIICLEAS